MRETVDRALLHEPSPPDRMGRRLPIDSTINGPYHLTSPSPSTLSDAFILVDQCAPGRSLIRCCLIVFSTRTSQHEEAQRILFVRDHVAHQKGTQRVPMASKGNGGVESMFGCQINKVLPIRQITMVVDENATMHRANKGANRVQTVDPLVK